MESQLTHALRGQKGSIAVLDEDKARSFLSGASI
jgi:hypothetical protein